MDKQQCPETLVVPIDKSAETAAADEAEFRVESSIDKSTQTAQAGLGAGLGVGLGLPVFCAFLFFLHVQLNFAADKRGKYLKYRFSHNNPRIPCGFMPKDARDALWAEIKGSKACQIAPIKIGMPEPEKEEKTTDV